MQPAARRTCRGWCAALGGATRVSPLTDQGIMVLGIPIPSSSPFFLATVGVHVAAGLICVIAGVVAMLSSKRVGRHPSAGTVYYWSLVVVFGSMTLLSTIRWPHDIHLFILGSLSFAAGFIGRAARRQLWVGCLVSTCLGWAFRTSFSSQPSTWITVQICPSGGTCLPWRT